MHFHIIFVITFFHYDSKADFVYEWQRYVWKTTSDCVNVKKHIYVNDMVAYLDVFVSCYHGIWQRRTQIQLFTHNTLSDTTVNHTATSPYLYGLVDSQRKQATAININVHQSFKLNLTLTRIEIQRSLSGCDFGKLNVSIW